MKTKKIYGQHFLRNLRVAEEISNSLSQNGVKYNNLLEIGPGQGVLTDYLIKKENTKLFAVEIDEDLIPHLEKKYAESGLNIIHKNFLKLDIKALSSGNWGIIGNFPYNVSSQILFKVLENKDVVIELVGMFQKEVGERIASPPGNKDYGILSVLCQAYYHISKLFIVDKSLFKPPPKVQSIVIRMERNEHAVLPCNEKLFFEIVKLSFNQRRKTLRNSLKKFNNKFEGVEQEILKKRPEELDVSQFIYLTQKLGE